MCPACGFAFPPSGPIGAAAPGAQPAPKWSGGRKTALIVGIIVGAICLLVAVTIVMSAVVFVLVSDLDPDGNDTVPSISFTVQQTPGREPPGRATVASADMGADWGELRLVRVSGAEEVRFALNRLPDASSARPPGPVSDTSILVEPGHYLQFCAPTPMATLALVHEPSGTQIRTFTFSSLWPCP